MTESYSDTIALTFVGKTYQIKCPTDKITELRESAQYLEDKMNAIGQISKIRGGSDKLAIITALNIVHELIMQKKQMAQQLRALQNKVDKVLAQNGE